MLDLHTIPEMFASLEGCVGPADYKAYGLRIDDSPAAASERVQAWKRSNSEHSREYDRARYKCNAAHRKGQAAAYYAANRDVALARRKSRDAAYYAANKDKIEAKRAAKILTSRLAASKVA